MERKIGEIFEYKGEWYQCVECTGCYQCAFNQDADTCLADNPHCTSRSDRKDVIFKKLEKVGEPYILFKDKVFQSYKRATDEIISCWDYNYIMIPCKETVEIEVKQNKEDMEEKNNGNTPLNVLTDKYVNGDICYDDFEKEVKALYSCKEEIKPTLKPFDLEAAKSGKPVCTRDGRKARIICFDYKGDSNAYPILALIPTSNLSGVPSEIIAKYTEDGRYAKYNNVENNEDLMMLTEKKEGWINVYQLNTCYKTKEEAEANIDRDYENEYVRTVKISREE